MNKEDIYREIKKAQERITELTRQLDDMTRDPMQYMLNNHRIDFNDALNTFVGFLDENLPYGIDIMWTTTPYPAIILDSDYEWTLSEKDGGVHLTAKHKDL